MITIGMVALTVHRRGRGAAVIPVQRSMIVTIGVTATTTLTAMMIGITLTGAGQIPILMIRTAMIGIMMTTTMIIIAMTITGADTGMNGTATPAGGFGYWRMRT